VIKLKTISNEGLKLIKSFEGCHLTTYDDLQPKVVLTTSTKIIGTLTIGWGHTGNDVTIGKTITQQEADRFLLIDLTKFIGYVNNISYVPVSDQLNQNQFDALVSFAYNCGQGNLRNLCTDRNINQIPDSMINYNKSKGNVLAGLIRRREAEKQLYKKMVNVVEQPNSDYLKRIVELEEIVKEIIIGLTTVADKLAEIEPPVWFVKEFPEAIELLNCKTGTNDFWRSFAVTLRTLKNLQK
jgi:GH24 family phage-related lysozyme (muramidase)